VVAEALKWFWHRARRAGLHFYRDSEGNEVDLLASGVKFLTISNQGRKDFDEEAFKDRQAFLEKTYPLAHKTLKREVIGDPRKYSLLYTWTGTRHRLDGDAASAPIVLMGHQDVVPVVPGTEKQWEQGAFSGDIAGGYIWGRGTLDAKGEMKREGGQSAR